jgi:hypothetical protein
VIWGRWAGGTTAGSLSAANPVLALPANGGIHYVLGRTSPDPRTVPNPGFTGKLAYKLIGSTPATSGDGVMGSGAVTGTATVWPEKNRIGLSLNVNGDVTYPVVTLGGSADPSASPLIFTEPRQVFTDGETLTVPQAGRACSDIGRPCHAAIWGFIAGTDYERLALVIQIAGGSDDTVRVTAVAVFARE